MPVQYAAGAIEVRATGTAADRRCGGSVIIACGMHLSAKVLLHISCYDVNDLVRDASNCPRNKVSLIFTNYFVVQSSATHRGTE